jgi:hypothetical protein
VPQAAVGQSGRMDECGRRPVAGRHWTLGWGAAAQGDVGLHEPRQLPGGKRRAAVLGHDGDEPAHDCRRAWQPMPER